MKVKSFIKNYHWALSQRNEAWCGTMGDGSAVTNIHVYLLW